MISSVEGLFWLQDILRKGLDVFLNGASLVRASHLLYPLVDRFEIGYWVAWQQQIAGILDHLQVIPEDIGMYGMPQSSLHIQPQSVAYQIVSLYTWLDAHMQDSLEVQAPGFSVSCLKPFEEKEYGRGGAYLRPILKLQSYLAVHLADLVVGAYLHGSMSTLDYVEGSSDLDVLVVVRQETLHSVDALLSVRRHLLHSLRWFYCIDHSQHHGYAVLSELDLSYYAESMFPSVLFSYLTPLIGLSVLVIQPRHEQGDPSAGCRRTIEYIRSVSAKPEALVGWFALKLYLQSVLLLPTLFLHAKGVRAYKRDAFALARPYFSDDAWSIIDKISQIRSLGVQSTPLVSRLDGLLARFPSPWLVSLVHRKLINQVPTQARAVLGDTWHDEAMRLADETEMALDNEN